MLTGYIRGQELRISTPEIAADSIKYLEAEFHFAGRDWDGYVKTAYFINGTSKFALVLADDRITADMGLNLTAGEWEVKLSGVKGGSRITTTTEHIFVREFGGTEGTLPDVTATQAEQILAKIGDLSNLTTEDKTNLVAAINEAAKSGGGSGGSGGGKDGTGIESITYKGKDEDGGNVYTVLLTDGTSYDITAPKGAAGADGTSVTVTSVTESTEDGGDNVITFSDGKSVTVKNGSKGSTGAKGDTGAAGPQGPAGAPGKDGAGMDITGATVGQTAKIAAVDASGVPTAWEPVDMPQGGGEEMRVIKTIAISDADVNSIYFNRDDNDQPFALTKHIRIRMYGAATNTGSTQAALFFRAGQGVGDKSQASYPIKVNSSNQNYIFDFVWDLYSASNCWYGDFAHARAAANEMVRYVPSASNDVTNITISEIKLIWNNAAVYFPVGSIIVVGGI